MGGLDSEPPAVELEVWDKSRGAGGRASTSRFGENNAQADTGLQYLSTTKPSLEGSPLTSLYEGMVAANVIAPMAARITGMNPKYVYQFMCVQEELPQDGQLLHPTRPPCTRTCPARLLC
jgi:hypothetical protein